MSKFYFAQYFVFPSLLLSYLSLNAQNAAAPPQACEEEEAYNLFNTQRRIFTNLEFLYWTVEESALEYAIHMKAPAWGPSPAFAKGRYKITDFGWDPGIRASVGFYNAPRYWEVLGQYTWIFVDGSHETHSPTNPNEFIEATWNEFTPTPLSKAKSHIDLHYHVGDFLVTRVFDTNPHLRLRLVGGATTSWIEQRWIVRYSNSSGNHDRIKNHWRFFGGGLRIGLTVDWFWGNHFYFTGRGSFASLIGTYKNRAAQKTNFAPLPSDDPNIFVRNIVYNDHRFSFHSQMMLGPSYQRNYDCFDFEIFAGYEFNIWSNLHEVYRSEQTSPGVAKENKLATGLTGLHGLTTRLTLAF